MPAISKAIQSVMDGKMLKNLSPGAWLGIGLNTYFGVSTYNQSREEGTGVIGSVARGAGEVLVSEVIGPGAYLGLLAAQALPKAAVQFGSTMNTMARSMSSLNRNTPFINATFNDTQQAFTMRQAGMQLAKASKYNLQQSMLGNEATYLHL